MSHIVWSDNDEDFEYESLEDLLASNDELKAGDTVYMGEAIPPKADDLVRTYDVIDAMSDRAYDMVGEHADGFPDVSDEAVAELKNFLVGWVNKHCQIYFWEVKNSKPYVITAEDMAEVIDN